MMPSFPHRTLSKGQASAGTGNRSYSRFLRIDESLQNQRASERQLTFCRLGSTCKLGVIMILFFMLLAFARRRFAVF